MVTFTAIDFETANRNRGSICAAGIVRVEDGIIARTESFLVRPNRTMLEFEYWNTRIHGITSDHVVDAPEWPEVYEWLTRIAGDDPMVAHNAAGADFPMMRSACALYGLAGPTQTPVCTMKMARRLLPGLANYKLPTVAAALGVEDFTHHDATADARAAALITVGLARQVGAASVDELTKAAFATPKAVPAPA